MPGNVHLALVTFELIMLHNGSLKDKRRIVRSVKDRLKHRLDLSVAEVGAQDMRQRARLAVACVGSDRLQVQRVLQEAQKIAESREGAEVWNWSFEWR